MKILLASQQRRTWTRLREVLLFVGVGVLNTAIDFAVLNLLIIATHHEQGLWLLAFNCLSFLTAAINSYILNGRFTFCNSQAGDRWRFIRFIAVSAGGLLINSMTVWALAPLASKALTPISAINGSKALATALSLCWNYVAIKRWIFRTEIPEITYAEIEIVHTTSVTLESDTHDEI
jgi:putative flippase GtrA